MNSVVIVVKCGKNRLKNPLKTTVTTVTTVTTPFSKTFQFYFRCEKPYIVDIIAIKCKKMFDICFNID